MGGHGGHGGSGGNGDGRPAEAAGTGLRFPCRFEIKAMGEQSHRFEALVQAIVSRHIRETDMLRTRARLSRNGRYVSITCIIWAKSRAQLDAIYQELSDCPDVLFAL